MSETEKGICSGGAERAGLSPTAEVRTALAGLMSDITIRLQKQEQRLNMLDRKSINMRRPALSAAAEVTAPHQKAFEAYVRTGDDGALRGLPLEEKALNMTMAGEGGYLVSPQTSERIMSVLRNSASIRQISNVVMVELDDL